MLAHVILLQLLEERDDGLVVYRLLWKLDALGFEPAVQRAELFVVRDVEEIDVLLYCVSGRLLGSHDTSTLRSTGWNILYAAPTSHLQ
jgi:hypothetical protein